MTSPQVAVSTLPLSLRDALSPDLDHEEWESLSEGSLPNVCCTVENERIVLSGRVSSFYHKQLAQERVRQCLGIDVIITNDLRVVRNS